MADLHSLDPHAHNHAPFAFEIRRTLWNTALKGCNHNKGSVSIPFEARLPDSPFIEMIWRGQAENDGVPLCPADFLWYMRFLRQDGKTSVTVHGPTTKPTSVPYNRNDEFLGIRFKAGLFMPHLPPGAFVDGAIDLSEAACQTFWLHGSVWEVPTYENADIFVNRLLHTGLLDYDPLVGAALQGHPQEMTLRSLQLRFLRATGLTHKVIQQVERARYAAALLEQGISIQDVVFKAAYFDQPHLTRSLKRFLGQTPSQIAKLSQQE